MILILQGRLIKLNETFYNLLSDLYGHNLLFNFLQNKYFSIQIYGPNRNIIFCHMDTKIILEQIMDTKKILRINFRNLFINIIFLIFHYFEIASKKI